MIQVSPRSSNVYSINVPASFKDAVIDKSQVFGGASEMIALCLDDLALRLNKLSKRLQVVEELNDYIKLEVLLMRKYSDDDSSASDKKLTFRLKDQVVKESLKIIKRKTGWNTSKTIRISLIWYLYANFDDFVATEDFIPLLKCEFCGYVTHDQRALAVHIKNLHEIVCPYCGKHYSNTDDHTCEQMIALRGSDGKQFTKDIISPALSDTSLSDTEKLQKIVDALDIDSLQPSPESIDTKDTTSSDIIDEADQKILSSLGLESFEFPKAPEDETEGIRELLPDKEMFDQSETQLKELSEQISEIGGTLLDLPKSNDDIAKPDKRKKKKEQDEELEKLDDEIAEILKSLKKDGVL